MDNKPIYKTYTYLNDIYIVQPITVEDVYEMGGSDWACVHARYAIYNEEGKFLFFATYAYKKDIEAFVMEQISRKPRVVEAEDALTIAHNAIERHFDVVAWITPFKAKVHYWNDDIGDYYIIEDLDFLLNEAIIEEGYTEDEILEN